MGGSATRLEPITEAFYGGDDKAFDALAAALTPRLVAWAFAGLRGHVEDPREAAGDIAQTVLIRFAATRGREVQWSPAKGRLLPWLRRFVNYELRNHLRHAWVRRECSSTGVMATGASDPLEQAAPSSSDPRFDPQAVRACVDKLPSDLRWLVIAVYFDGETAAAISLALDVHPTTISRRLAKARRLLREMLTAMES